MKSFISGLDGILRHISIVYNILKKSCFRPYRTKEFDLSMRVLKSYLDANETETVIFCCIFFVFYKSGETPVAYFDLANPDVLNCNPLYLLRYREDLNNLVERKLIRKVESEHGEPFYLIPDYVTRAIVANQAKITFPQMDDDDEDYLIPVEKIKERSVFFADDIEEKIKKYSDLLKHESFAAKQDELRKKSLPSGIGFVFTGAHRTEKKNAAMAVAKQSGRGVFVCNLKDLTSHLLQEPDSLKMLFASYKKVCENEKLEGRHKPVFVMEGASLILQKRYTNPDNELEGMLQILQDNFESIMESFSGILIALCDDYDEAFDNNFFGNIFFPEPTDESKLKIWQNKIDWIDENTATNFSNKFALGAEEISKVAKRIQIDEVLEGKRPTPAVIEEYCRNERKHMQKHSSGFLANS